MTWFADLLLLLWFCSYSALVIFRYREPLIGYWREPVFRHPILIIESDDWGPAGDADAQALDRLRILLSAFKDRQGRHPMMTIGTVLAVADTQRLREDGLGEYHRRFLHEAAFAPLRQALQRGEKQGVFALQLHGLEHYRPESLLAAAQTNETVRRWLTQAGLPRTEELPSHLQSRWTDAAILPSHPIDAAEIRDAVAEEVTLFEHVFGKPPRVVVPPTFLWTEAVERAWAEHGVEVIITPGQRYEARDGNGGLVAARGLLYNGQVSANGPIYLVRNNYFEPNFGHTAETGLQVLSGNSSTARATLLESHRFNYVGEGAERAFRELERLLTQALSQVPGLCFMSSAELAGAIQAQDARLIESHMRARLRPWLRRLAQVPGLRKHAWLSGLMLLAGLFYALGYATGIQAEPIHA